MEEHNFGVAPSRFDIRDYRLRINRNIATAARYPKEFELKMPQVKYQGYVGSCVAHALSTIIEYFNIEETKQYKEMSTAYIYGNRRNTNWKNSGMRIRDALKNACEYGDIEHSLLPDNVEVPKAITYFEKEGAQYKEQGRVNRIKKFFKIDSSKALKEYIMNTGPALVSIKWYKNTTVELPGYVIKPKGTDYELHCVVCYGWNEKGWKIQNSWGLGWGHRGNAILPYNEKFREMWGLEDEQNHISDISVIITPYKGQIGDKIAKGVNNIVNLILGRK